MPVTCGAPFTFTLVTIALSPVTIVKVPGTVPPLHIVIVCGLLSPSLLAGSPLVISASGVGHASQLICANDVFTIQSTQEGLPPTVLPSGSLLSVTEMDRLEPAT